jgi:putative sterol carrier protein
VTATVIIDGGKVDILEGIFGKTDLIVYADSESWIRFLNKEISLLRTILSRKIKTRGNPLLLKKFQDCLLIF